MLFSGPSRQKCLRIPPKQVALRCPLWGKGYAVAKNIDRRAKPFEQNGKRRCEAAIKPIHWKLLLMTVLISAALPGAGCRKAPEPVRGNAADWPHYGRDEGGSRYSPLDEITPQNVEFLKLAWTYRTGDVSDGKKGFPKSAFEATPLLIDGTLYVATPLNRIIALDLSATLLRLGYGVAATAHDADGAGSAQVRQGPAPHRAPAAGARRRGPGASCRARVRYDRLAAKLASTIRLSHHVRCRRWRGVDVPCSAERPAATRTPSRCRGRRPASA